MRIHIAELPGSLRLAVGSFAALVLGFVLLAQANLFVHVGGGQPVSPRQVLVRYHGDPDRTLLHEVLDPDLPHDSPRNMSQFLGGFREDEITKINRKLILGWVDDGAPEDGWREVESLFKGVGTCGACHAPEGARQDVPLQTYADVLHVVRPGEPPPLGPLLITAHNHLFGFAVLALLLSLGLCFSSIGGRLRNGLIVAASGGAALDVGGWFLTRVLGSPFHLMVMLGGGLFGLSVAFMALVVLRDAFSGGPTSTAESGSEADHGGA